MTGLINTASAGDSELQPHLCVTLDEGDPELAPESPPGPDAWRSEVAARLARYRTRRKPRPPRYPSLLLPFDASENRPRSAGALAATDIAPDASSDEPFPRPDTGIHENASPVPSSDDLPTSLAELRSLPSLEPGPEHSAKIIEFPRSAAIPIFHASPLADPILDRPRIVEAPEVVPPPPALGGILIEPAPKAVDPRADHEPRIQSASIGRRLLATLIDALILGVALSGYAAIFLRFNPVRGPGALLAGITAATAVLVWMAYQFVFVVYTGSTPGLRAARLTVARFDGSAVQRPVRRWRVLASFLSAFSAGLGYLWCFIDQDSLCWHDRITRTHLQPASAKPTARPPL